MKINAKTELPKKWVPKSIFDPFWLDLETLWEPQEGSKASKSQKIGEHKAQQDYIELKETRIVW